MRPPRIDNSQIDLFSPPLSTQLNPRHPLLILASKIPWEDLEPRFSGLFSDAPGQPPKPIRLMVGLLMLQHMENLSDEAVVAKWVENPYWQFFCGYDTLQWQFPAHPTSLTRWRGRP